MRSADVFWNGILAGSLIEENVDKYVYEYAIDYFIDPARPAISLSLPKTKQVHTSSVLFPFFSNLLAEGRNRSLQTRLVEVSEGDDFGLLSVVAGADTIGAITVVKRDS
ncbi:MAG: HipA N-terminal domain-containing protein [Bacteroidetes bacterium]|nr:HipA N-terminal domain-containing protein [Bacteroidota bacterium]